MNYGSSPEQPCVPVIRHPMANGIKAATRRFQFCGAVAVSPRYAICRVDARFPNLAAEKGGSHLPYDRPAENRPTHLPPFCPSQLDNRYWCGICVCFDFQGLRPTCCARATRQTSIAVEPSFLPPPQ